MTKPRELQDLINDTGALPRQISFCLRDQSVRVPDRRGRWKTVRRIVHFIYWTVWRFLKGD